MASLAHLDDSALAASEFTVTRQRSSMDFEELYAQQFVPMVKFATLMNGSADVARDIVQDAFVKLHVKWAGVDHPKAYLRTSVVNGCRTRARWERRRRGRRSDIEPIDEQRPEELNDVLGRLSTRQRAAIVLRFYEQHSEAEIAKILRCRPGTVGSLISRGLSAMKNELTEITDWETDDGQR